MNIEGVPPQPDEPEISLNRLAVEKEGDYVERIRLQAEGIIDQCLSEYGVVNHRVVEAHKTRKSVFGCVEVEGEKRFFKISKPSRILQELQGYKIAAEYPHERIVDHFFLDDYGLYLQDYCEEISTSEGQMQSQINRILQQIDTQDVQKVLQGTGRLFDTMGSIFQRHFTKMPLILHGQNDRFFYDRVKPGGRIDQLYAGRMFNFPSLSESITFEDLSKLTFVVNGEIMSLTLGELIKKARHDLSPEHNRFFVLSQGDPTETNMALCGKFFDFETGGYNDLIQDIAIFSYYNYSGGHYFIPKYFNTETLSDMRSRDRQEYDSLSEFSSGVTVSCELDRKNQKLVVNGQFPYPKLKQEIYTQFRDSVVRPVTRLLPAGCEQELVGRLQSAFLLRAIGVKDIAGMDEKDLILSLILANHFAQPDPGSGGLIDFLDQKMVDIHS